MNLVFLLSDSLHVATACYSVTGLRGGRYADDKAYGPMICDTEVVLSKGTHKLSFNQRGRGNAATLLGGNPYSSVILLEELLHA